MIDLSEATPIVGAARDAFLRIFKAGRRVLPRGVGEDHFGLLALPQAA